jgi:hypothetical protein
MEGLNVRHRVWRRAVDLQLQVRGRFFHAFERVRLPIDGSNHVYGARFRVDGKEVRIRCTREVDNDDNMYIYHIYKHIILCR